MANFKSTEMRFLDSIFDMEEGMSSTSHCMSGENIYKALGRRIPLADLIERKVRAAAETGAAFVTLDELFEP